MALAMRSDMTPQQARQALAWLIEMGADEIALDEPVNQLLAKPKPQPAPAPVLALARPVTVKAHVEDCATIAELIALLERFDACPLKKTASHLAFAAGNFDADLMVVGDVAGKDEDLAGTPFAGDNELLLSKMLAAIGISPEAEVPAQSASLFNLIPWRPPGNRPPIDSEVTQCLPFLERAIAICRPKFILCLGNLAAQKVTGSRGSLMRLRGQWQEHETGGIKVPVIASFHPRMLLQQASQKRLAWRDLLTLKEAMANG
jgi:uracil-DNA glycosylase